MPEGIQTSFRYLSMGLTRIKDADIRAYVLIPLIINMVLFSALSWWAYAEINELLSSWGAQASSYVDWEWLNDIIVSTMTALSYLLVILLIVGGAYFFSSIVHLISAPFNGLLAAKVDEVHTQIKMPEESIGEVVARTLPRELSKLWYWITRALALAVICFVLGLIPLVNALVPVIWFAFGSWMMGIAYLDYAADGRMVSFKDMESHLIEHKWTVLSFGAIVFALTIIPIVNLVIIPWAVTAGTLLWTDKIKPPTGETLASAGEPAVDLPS